MRCGRRGWLGAMTAMALCAQVGEAQRADEPVGRVGIAFLVGEPQGDMGYLVDEGFGLQLDAGFPVAADGHLRVRGDFGFMIYGHERQEFCYATPIGCRIGVDLMTDNAILFAGIGPEIVLATGAVEPYVNASFGFSYFVTTSSLGDDSGYDDYATTTNFSDGLFAWRAGGGVRVRVSGGHKPVYLDFAVERHENGIAEYLTEGDIVDHADGSITLYPNRTEANLVTFRMGVAFGIPGTRGHH